MFLVYLQVKMIFLLLGRHCATLVSYRNTDIALLFLKGDNSMKNSLKQMFRMPWKTSLLFLLLVMATLLLLLSGGMLWETTQRIKLVENEFTTLGTIEQLPIATRNTTYPDPCWEIQQSTEVDYGRWLTPEDLMFEGAQYIQPPENRPLYLSYLPDYAAQKPDTENDRYHIAEFTPLEDSEWDDGPIEVRITKVLLNNPRPPEDWMDEEEKDHLLEPGEVIQLCRERYFNQSFPVKKGKTYIASFSYNFIRCPVHGIMEYILDDAPYTGQQTLAGEIVESELIGRDHRRYVQEVTDDFYEEGQPGQLWLQWAQIASDLIRNVHAVLPTDALELLPTEQKGWFYLREGRKISREEFKTGAQVCMIPVDVARLNDLEIGDKITLPLYCAVYGYDNRGVFAWFYPNSYSFLNAEGEFYTPFWEAEYEIVGTYMTTNKDRGAGDFVQNMFIIPARSVKASDENNITYAKPMNAVTASFQLKNGTAEEFDKRLHEAVPGLENVEILYDDGGYSEVMDSLSKMRVTAVLLFLISLMAVVVIVLLVLYFFVIKQKKRTAIERSLGMTKRQCRISIATGLCAVTLLASILGGIGGFALKNAFPTLQTQESEEVVVIDEESVTFSRQYSSWAQADSQADREMNKLEESVSAPLWFYFVCPVLLTLTQSLLAMLLVNRNLKIEPIYLLSGKME